MTLWDLGEGQKGTVAALATTIPTRYIGRLEQLGIFVKREVECIKHLPFGGPKVIRIGNCVFSLSKEIAQHISVDQKVSR